MDAPRDDLNDLDAQIARQLPVISAQRDSLAAVILTRWLRLAVAHGPASLEVTHHHRQERWELRWCASNHRAHAVMAPTLAELLVRLLAEIPGVERQRWTGGVPPALAGALAPERVDPLDKRHRGDTILATVGPTAHD
jgi:hypothetical protein